MKTGNFERALKLVGQKFGRWFCATELTNFNMEAVFSCLSTAVRKWGPYEQRNLCPPNIHA